MPRKKEPFFTVGHKGGGGVPVAVYYTLDKNREDVPIGLRTADKPQLSDYNLDTVEVTDRLAELQYGPTVRRDVLIDMLQSMPGNIISIAFNANNMVLIADYNPGAPDNDQEWHNENVAVLLPMHPGIKPEDVDKIIEQRLRKE